MKLAQQDKFRLFCFFLKNKNAYLSWRKQMSSKSNLNKFEKIEDVLLNTIDWCSSKEGYKFWSQLDKKWYSIYNMCKQYTT